MRGNNGRGAVVFILFAALTLSPAGAMALTEGAFFGGLGYFMENSIGKQTQSSDGKTSLLGTPNYPLILKYDWKPFSKTFISPTFFYTLFERESAGKSSKVNLWHLVFPFGRNFANDRWDWSAGLGLLNRTIKGKGGTVTLNNGNSTSTFSLPGRTTQSKTITLNGGIGFNIGRSRLAFDLTIEGASSSKRSYDLMFSYMYAFYSSRP